MSGRDSYQERLCLVECLVGRLVGEQKRKMDSERAEVERKILLRREYADKVKHR